MGGRKCREKKGTWPSPKNGLSFPAQSLNEGVLGDADGRSGNVVAGFS